VSGRPDPARVLASLTDSRKYSRVCADALARIAAQAARSYRTFTEADKAARRKLHQALGAFVGEAELDDVERLLAALPAGAGPEKVADTCRIILGLHASSAERLPVMERLYGELARRGKGATILDLCCGLNPFSLPWMAALAPRGYLGLDLDTRMSALANGFLARYGPGFGVRAADVLSGAADVLSGAADVLSGAADVLVGDAPVCGGAADLVLLLKSATTLERQEKGSVERLLGGLKAFLIVVSFPVRSLGGKEKGMRENYEAEWVPRFEAAGFTVERIPLAEEDFYLIRR